MAITDKKISTVYSDRDLASLSDRPNEDGLTAAQLKARFDQLPKEVIPQYNALIDELNDTVLPSKVDKVAGKSLIADTEITRLLCIETGAEVNNISDVNANDLTDGGDTNLHTHDSRYYTETEVDTLLLNKSDTTHTHDLIKNATEANAKVEALATGVNINRVTSGGNLLTLQYQGSTKAYFNTAGYLWATGLANSADSANGLVDMSAAGSKISRNKADANPALIVNQANASSTGKILDLQFNGTSKVMVDGDGTVRLPYASNIASTNNGYLWLPNAGPVIARNVADAFSALTVNQIHASSTGKIADFQFGGVSKASIAYDGTIKGSYLSLATFANGAIYLNTNILTAQRNIADSNPAFIINQQNASSTGRIVDFQFGGVSKAWVNTVGSFYGTNLKNYLDASYSGVGVNVSGTVIDRNIGDANTCLKVNQAHASSTGNIAEFQFNGTTKLAIDKDGLLPASNIVNTPAGNIASTTVQGAINELDTEKADKLFATNLVTNGDFSNGTTGWNTSNATGFAVVGGVAEFTANAQNGRIDQATVQVLAGQKYYARALVKSTSSSVSFRTTDAQVGGLTLTHSGNNAFQVLSGIYTQTVNATIYARVVDARASAWDKIYSDNILFINLTTTFGAGKEPTLNEIETMLSTFPNSWFNGTAELVNIANLAQLKADKTQEAWITPTLINSWTAVSGYPVQYRRNQFGNIEFRGRITGGTSGAFLIIDGYRPATEIRQPLPDLGGNIRTGAVYANGYFYPTMSTYTTSVDISAFSYPTT